jgi:MFS family permease
VMATLGLGVRAWIVRKPGRPAIYRIAAGGLVDSLGSSAMAVAFGFFLYDRTGSAVWLSAWYFLSFGITGVLTPVAGWLADRFDRRRLIIISDLAAAACSLALIAASGPVALVTIAFIASILGHAGHPAFGAALPNLVGEEKLEWANGTMGVALNIGSLIGPVLGGALYVAAGRSVVFAFDAATYLIATGAVLSLRMPFRAPSAADDGRDVERRGLLRGFRVVLEDPILRALIIIWTLGYFAVDIVLVGELPLARALGAGALAFGILEAAWGAGSIIGSLVGRKLRKDQGAVAILIGIVGIAIGQGLIAVSPWFIPVVVLMGIVAVANGIEDVAGYSLMQRRSADEVRGRVLSAFGTLGLMANAVAFAIAGVIVEAFGPRAVFALGAVVSALCVPFLRPLFRERTPELAADASDPEVSEM